MFVHFAIDFMAKFAKLAYQPLFVALTFWNWLEHRNSDFRILHGNDSSTLCQN